MHEGRKDSPVARGEKQEKHYLRVGVCSEEYAKCQGARSWNKSDGIQAFYPTPQVDQK